MCLKSKGQSLAATQFTAQGYKLGMWPNSNKTWGVESGTDGVMVKAVEVAWLEPVVRSGCGKAGTGGVDFGYGERERKGAGRGRVWERKGVEEDEERGGKKI